MNYIMDGEAYPIIGGTQMKDGTKVPIIDLPLQSDYEWQRGCLLDRLEHREKYISIGEDVDAVIERLLSWLEEHTEQEDNRYDDFT